MKKVYEKPQLYVESFYLSEHIANSCGAAAGVTHHGNGMESGCYFPVEMEDPELGTLYLNLFTDTSYCSEEVQDFIIGNEVMVDFFQYHGRALLPSDIFSS